MTESTPTEQLERPSLFITLSNGRQIKMTYGLEMDIRRMLPDPVSAMQLALSDPFTQDYIVRRCLTAAVTIITDVNELSEEVSDIQSEDVERLVMWAVEHVLYFFAKQTSALAALGQKYQTALQSPSTAGSES